MNKKHWVTRAKFTLQMMVLAEKDLGRKLRPMRLWDLLVLVNKWDKTWKKLGACEESDAILDEIFEDIKNEG